MNACRKIIIIFLWGYGNEFSNPIGTLRGPDFPISVLGYGNAYVSFCFCLLYESFYHLSAKAFFKTAFY